MKFASKKTEDLNAIVAELVRRIRSKKSANTYAMVIALHGNLGAGKTTLIQAFGKHIGINEPIISPTFIILKRYAIKWAGFTTLYHIDTYRLTNSNELKSLGIDAILREHNALVCIEWPEKIMDMLPHHYISVNIEHVSEKERNISIN